MALNAVYPVFEPIQFKSQVVSGINYLVKIRVGEGVFDFVHAKIHVPLPHTGQPPSLKGVSGNHDF